jgi:hypothetical protein
LFYYYNDYSTSLPLYTSSVCFFLREIRGGFRKRKARGGGAEEERRGGRETLAPPFARVFKTDPTLVIYKILEKTLVL